MNAINRLTTHLEERNNDLKVLKGEGVKIVGYVPNGYMPEELVYACGAIPVGLIRGGEHEPVAASEKHLFPLLDTFCRSQIGYRILGKELIYQLPDLLVVPITDRNITAIADSWQLYTDVPVFKLGVPRYTDTPHALKYYVDGLRSLKQRLEELTGIEIRDERLKEEIELSNRIRTLLAKISLTRKNEHPHISGSDFIGINHATYYADRNFLLQSLESILKKLEIGAATKNNGPRIMLVGSTMAEGDDKVIKLIEQNNASIVIEEFSEGVRHYRQKVKPNASPIEALADRYLRRRIPPAFFHDSIKKRFDYLLGLVEEFKVDGIVWYSLMYRDSYDREGALFTHLLGENMKIPLLKLNSDYSAAETAQMRTRIEAFIEILKG